MKWGCDCSKCHPHRLPEHPSQKVNSSKLAKVMIKGKMKILKICATNSDDAVLFYFLIEIQFSKPEEEKDWKNEKVNR